MVSKCIVRGCVNEWYPGSSITYHTFPKDKSRRDLWLSKIKLKSKFYECAKICSLHFNKSDYYAPSRLKNTASPVGESESSVLDEACRVCLTMERKLYNINENNLCDYYEELSGLSAANAEGVNLPCKLCWECAQRLVSFKRLKAKAMRSYDVMLELFRTSQQISRITLGTIHRLDNGLKSHLGVRFFDPDHADYHVEDEVSHDEEIVIIDKTEMEQIEAERLEEEGVFDTEHLEIDPQLIPKSVIKVKKKRKRRRVIKIDKRRRPARDILDESIFDITDLSYAEQFEEIEKRRESSNFRNSEYKCSFCFKGFSDESAYKGHMARHTDQSGTHGCDVCKIRFETQRKLKGHALSHVQKFTCKRCPYVTTRRHAAKRHEEYHNGRKYPCPHCQDQFVKFSTYMSHVRLKHPSDSVCELCGRSFIGAKGLCLHKRLKHRFDQLPMPEDAPKCSQCNVNFASKEALERHLKLSPRHDTNNDPRRRGRGQSDCQTRSKENVKSFEKNSRRSDAKSDTTISCEQCEMQLPDSVSYYRHFRRTHPGMNRTKYPSMKSKCMCEVCGKMFQSLALLHDHGYTHGEAKQFKCSLCGKRFQRRYRLIAHRRVHSAARATHECRLCDKRFSTASNMTRHMFSHTGLKPFKCEMCGKGFKHASEKRVHVTYVHLKKPWPKRSRGKRKSDTGQEEVAPSASLPMHPNCTDVAQPLWKSCNEMKITDRTIEDKIVYYDIKV